MGYSFRTKDYRYTVWLKNKKSTDRIYIEDIHAEELYDYKKDINETENKIDDGDYKQIKLSFQTLAARFFNTQTKIEKDETKEKVQNNKFAKNRADIISKFIAEEMKLSDKNLTFLQNTLYNKYETNANKTRGKNLNQEQKRLIYRATYAETRKKLLSNFTTKEVLEIGKLERIKQRELSNR